MKLCIIGWYGTETLGDRAILGGIFRIFSEINIANTFSIGSLYPFFSRRTLQEEGEYYKKLSNDSEIYCFDMKDKERFRQEIQKCDMIIMGGGPLMDLYEMEMIHSAFLYAQKKGKRTAIFGCGVGPLHNNTYKKILGKISNKSDLIILRDNYSKKLFQQVMKKYGCKEKDIYVCGDPAFLGVDITKNTSQRDSFSVVNIRDYTYAFDAYKSEIISKTIKDKLLQMAQLSDRVLLLPNHTFCLGGDDRAFFTRIIQDLPREKFVIFNKPLNLEETFVYISKAKVCMAMRYHAVLFQTILNGNNYILDYTEQGIGKISGFLESIPDSQFYNNRYLNISDKQSNFDFDGEGQYSSITCANMNAILEKYKKILMSE